jgi:hypothetical protein
MTLMQSKTPYPMVERVPILYDFESRKINMRFDSIVDLALPGDANFYSGARYIITLDRETGFYFKFYIGPSIIFVLISYSSFWISRAAAMARISLCTMSILIAVQFRNNISLIIPQIKERVWLEYFITSVLWFTIFAIVEYAFVNFTD